MQKKSYVLKDDSPEFHALNAEIKKYCIATEMFIDKMFPEKDFCTILTNVLQHLLVKLILQKFFYTGIDYDEIINSQNDFMKILIKDYIEEGYLKFLEKNSGQKFN